MFNLASPKSRYLSVFIAGALNVLAFAPYSITPLAFISPAILLWFLADLSSKQAFRTGWAYGLGFMGFGIFWMHISIAQFGGIGFPLGIVFTLAFITVASLYYALVAILWTTWGQKHSQTHRLLILFPALWVAVEWVRSWFLTGFPWLSEGFSQINSPLAGFAPVLGVFGVSWVLILISSSLVLALKTQRLWLLTIPTGLYLLGFGLTQINFTQAKDSPIQVSLVQANIQQSGKWEASQLQHIIQQYEELSKEGWQSDLMIWPETAIPAFSKYLEQPLLIPLSQQAKASKTALLIGLPIWDESSNLYFNGMISLSKQRETYYKRHLVPFGEYLPFKKWLTPLLNWLKIPMSNFSYGTSATPLLTVGQWQAAISICYEDAFGDETRQALPQAEFLINASNDAWFGDSIAPHQHLEMAKMRALETGRYMLRVTSTGISAFIDEKGQEISRSQQFTATVLTDKIQPMQGSTPYVWLGNYGILSILAMIFTWLFITKLNPNYSSRQIR